MSKKKAGSSGGDKRIKELNYFRRNLVKGDINLRKTDISRPVKRTLQNYSRRNGYSK